MLVCQRDDHKQNFLRTAALADLLSAAVDSSHQLPSHGPSLLRFYAAESGLKYLLNRAERVPFSYEVRDQSVALDNAPLSPKNPGKVEGYSHDLGLMLRRLKVSAASVSPPVGPFRTVNGYNNGQDFEIPRAHEAWRYGLATAPADQAALETFLTAVITYVQGEI
ncbi:hypothetical protein [Pseudomonas sp. TMW 2.1634]|uniref:hypothetical protein n=1 Tax=Pseudomonas sp. TMW 2.1634 TaxID=1886807 RepID=UPI0013C4CE8D|nr:hypothetical protein [Pseudomonas sp. TMW 2.1634]